MHAEPEPHYALCSRQHYTNVFGLQQMKSNDSFQPCTNEVSVMNEPPVQFHVWSKHHTGSANDKKRITHRHKVNCNPRGHGQFPSTCFLKVSLQVSANELTVQANPGAQPDMQALLQVHCHMPPGPSLAVQMMVSMTESDAHRALLSFDAISMLLYGQHQPHSQMIWRHFLGNR